jgi:hypothetical protein
MRPGRASLLNRGYGNTTCIEHCVAAAGLEVRRLREPRNRPYLKAERFRPGGVSVICDRTGGRPPADLPASQNWSRSSHVSRSGDALVGCPRSLGLGMMRAARPLRKVLHLGSVEHFPKDVRLHGAPRGSRASLKFCALLGGHPAHDSDASYL